MPKFDESEQTKHLDELHRKEEEELVAMLAGKYGHQYINLHGLTINTDALRLVEESRARVAELALFEKINKIVRVGVRNPNKKEARDILEELSGRGFKPEIFMISTASLAYAWERYEDIKRTIARQKGVMDIASEEIARLASTIHSATDIAGEIAHVAKAKGQRSVSDTLEVILGGALALGASDVHLEPEETTVRLRVRVDGVLMDVADISVETYRLLSSRLKLISGLKLNITDRAQDGRFSVDLGEKRVPGASQEVIDSFDQQGEAVTQPEQSRYEKKQLDIRSSLIPGGYGESIVMRILDPTTISRTMEELGINEALFAVIDEELRRPNGMIITTGPTGSGKTTSLYAFLRRIHQPGIKIVTLEDPIEYHLEGIVQTQVSDETYTFATGLRAILRQDPDVIMVGEIRDRDVAETAVHAALTGHLVLSTLHTNSAVGSFPRLIDLGIDARMIGSSTNLALAQRLVRRLCPHCKKERRPTDTEKQIIHSFLAALPSAPDITKPFVLHDAVGCEKCGKSGFRGRIGIYEGIRVDSAVELAIISDPREDNILSAAASQNIPNMQQDGLIKALVGMTSLAELERIVDLHGEKGVRHSSEKAAPGPS